MGQPAENQPSSRLHELRARLAAEGVAPLPALGLREVAPLPVSPAFDALLAGPDEPGGLPRGGIVELAAAHGLGRATSLALDATASAQRVRSALGETGARAWCAWVDPSRSLSAPGVRARGVALDRLLVVRPEPAETVRAAIRLVEARAFALVVVDLAPLPGAAPLPRAVTDLHPNVVRRLSLACEGSERAVLLLTDASPRSFRAPLPVALRIELGAGRPGETTLRVTKDRRGRRFPQGSIAC